MYVYRAFKSSEQGKYRMTVADAGWMLAFVLFGGKAERIYTRTPPDGKKTPAGVFAGTNDE